MQTIWTRLADFNSDALIREPRTCWTKFASMATFCVTNMLHFPKNDMDDMRR